MKVIRDILAAPLPTDVLANVDTDDLCETIWWKVKKWCLHILVRTFERFDNPIFVVSTGNFLIEYAQVVIVILRIV